MLHSVNLYNNDYTAMYAICSIVLYIFSCYLEVSFQQQTFFSFFLLYFLLNCFPEEMVACVWSCYYQSVWFEVRIVVSSPINLHFSVLFLCSSLPAPLALNHETNCHLCHYKLNKDSDKILLNDMSLYSVHCYSRLLTIEISSHIHMLSCKNVKILHFLFNCCHT